MAARKAGDASESGDGAERGMRCGVLPRFEHPKLGGAVNADCAAALLRLCIGGVRIIENEPPRTIQLSSGYFDADTTS